MKVMIGLTHPHRSPGKATVGREGGIEPVVGDRKREEQWGAV